MRILKMNKYLKGDVGHLINTFPARNRKLPNSFFSNFVDQNKIELLFKNRASRLAELISKHLGYSFG